VKEVNNVLEVIVSVTTNDGETTEADRLTDAEISIVSSSLETVAKVLEESTNITDEMATVCNSYLDGSTNRETIYHN